MPNWNDVLAEIRDQSELHQRKAQSALDDVRRGYIKRLQEYTKRNTIFYYSSWLSKPGIQGAEINDSDKNAFMAAIHEMDRGKGLDLVLHTPGGNIAATESLVNYLRQMFGNDIRAIIPQIAMSAGTMIALSCRSVVLGKQSNLGPIDPQINGIPAEVIVKEFQRAYDEIKQDLSKAHVWQPILSRYTPSFLTSCEYAVQWSKEFVRERLLENMLSSKDDKEIIADQIIDQMSDTAENKTHSKHIHKDRCIDLGINVEVLEDDQQLQELVLTCHHCYMHTLSTSSALKIVENHDGRASVQNAPMQGMQMPTISIGLGSLEHPSDQ